MRKLTDVLKPFVTPLTVPPLMRAEPFMRIRIVPESAEIYNDGRHRLTVPVWTYEGHYPGPIIETRRGEAVTVEWENRIPDYARLPCVADEVAYHAGPDEVIPQNVPDQGQPANPTMGADGKGYISTHLHGGKTIPGSDGWPESMLLPMDTRHDRAQSNLARYENDQRAALLWYHDHAMHTTRLNVYAGLAGGWLIRDEEEAALDLPAGDRELPLIIQDRNLADFDGFEEAQQDGHVHARFLHRVETAEGPLEFFGPLTLVNGRIWPRATVAPTAYRLRVLNGSNARFYRLRLAEQLDDGRWRWVDDVPIRQIGTDNGLMDRPVALPENGLILAPAERADLIIDFSGCAGRKLVWLNTAEAPFSNADPLPLEKLFPEDPATCQVDGEAWRTPYPQVMMFHVRELEKGEVPAAPYDFDALAQRMRTAVKSWQAEDPIPRLPEKPVTRTVMLVEKTEMHMGHERVVLVQWELAPLDQVRHNSSAPILKAQRRVIIDGEPYVVVAERFQDPVTFIVRYGDTERWRFINLTADTHPMHLHLVQFRALSRRQARVINPDCVYPDGHAADPEDVVDVVDCKALTLSPIEVETGDELGFDENELGYKDTIRVNPGEMVEIAATFEGYTGRYVYHCHLLEHEDHDMMRQFIVTRDDMMMATGLHISVGADREET